MSFRFMNSFLALYYYAFADLGIARLSVSLFSFMIAGQMVNYVFSIFIPYVIARLSLGGCAELSGVLCCGTQQLVLAQVQSVACYPHANRARRVCAAHAPRILLHSSLISRVLLCGVISRQLDRVWIESNKPEYEPFERYCACVVQFAYVTLFSVAFPLAPLCALINNLVELRADSYKLLWVCRRPVARRSGGIGIWLDVLQCVGVLAVLTNCALMGFTSTQLNTWLPNISNSDKLLAIFVFEV
jgi:hypothetical protein